MLPPPPPPVVPGLWPRALALGGSNGSPFSCRKITKIHCLYQEHFEGGFSLIFNSQTLPKLIQNAFPKRSKQITIFTNLSSENSKILKRSTLILSPWAMFRELLGKIVFQASTGFSHEKKYQKPVKNHAQTMKKSMQKKHAVFSMHFEQQIWYAELSMRQSKSNKFHSQNHYFLQIAFWIKKSRALRVILVHLGEFGKSGKPK